MDGAKKKKSQSRAETARMKINTPLYMLFAANCIYAVSEREFNWLFYVALALTAITLLLNIWEVLRVARERKE